MSDWQENFETVLGGYLAQHGVQAVGEQVHAQIQKLSGSSRRGIWNFVGEKLGVSPASARNFYHNTWIRRFFAPVGEHAAELDRLATENYRLSPAALAAIFQAQHPDKVFCSRYLQQLLFNKLRKARDARADRARRPIRPVKPEKQQRGPKEELDLELSEQPFFVLDFLAYDCL